MAGEENDAEVSRKLYDMVINSDETSRRGVCISKEKMLERIAKSDAVVKSQQRDEPDLTDEKRYEILDEILTKKPATFLYRFGTFVSEEDLGYFNNLEDDYEIKFYLKEIKKQLNSKEHKRKVRNRRYECMKKLKSDTDYFGDREMRKRCPLLFEQYVGQFMTDEEYHKMDSNCDETFSGFLFSCIDKARLSEKFEHEKEQEECMEEEEETDSDEDDVEKHEKINSSGSGSKIPETEKRLLHEEFVSIMEERFIEGNDEEFDYSEVDFNQEYDSLVIRQRDEEEAYFDDELPETCSDNEDNYKMADDDM